MKNKIQQTLKIIIEFIKKCPKGAAYALKS